MCWQDSVGKRHTQVYMVVVFGWVQNVVYYITSRVVIHAYAQKIIL